MTQTRRILVIGGGIGGLTAAIAMRRQGIEVDLIERDPDWSVYGVGIIQQSNVIRAMAELDLLDEYLDAGCGFDQVEIYIPTGQQVATVPSPQLVPGKPANVGIGRRALQKVLADRAIGSGTHIRLGITASDLLDDGSGVDVCFSDGGTARYDAVIAADGIYSVHRKQLFPDAPAPEFTGQSVWRYNFPRPANLTGLCVFNGPIGIGLVPMSRELMYMFVTTPEPDNRWYDKADLAAAMRDKLAGVPAPQIRALAAAITDNDGVVYRPLETFFLEGPWHKGRIALLGDAVHSTTPHLGQGAGMAIEDAIVLAEELAAHDELAAAFEAYRARRFDRCRYIVQSSRAICDGQIGRGPPVDNHAATVGMFEVVAKAI
ncbi:FAD-dependent oxidoreductase [Croceibacterium sp. TMG7-5b_MA50]|uniref:FAD-dependent oxidoreductase n=1 Tax=Croceibacterium sp. TMG7-5b_MA50 TaxID=3121290 RepID=UPI00322155E8